MLYSIWVPNVNAFCHLNSVQICLTIDCSPKEIAKNLLQVIFKNELVHFTLSKLDETTKYVVQCLNRRFNSDFIYMSEENQHIPQSEHISFSVKVVLLFT